MRVFSWDYFVARVVLRLAQDKKNTTNHCCIHLLILYQFLCLHMFFFSFFSPHSSHAWERDSKGQHYLNCLPWPHNAAGIVGSQLAKSSVPKRNHCRSTRVWSHCALKDNVQYYVYGTACTDHILSSISCHQPPNCSLPVSNNKAIGLSKLCRQTWQTQLGPYHSTAMPFARRQREFICVCWCPIVYAGGFGTVKGHWVFVEAVFVCFHWQMDGACVWAHLEVCCHCATYIERDTWATATTVKGILHICAPFAAVKVNLLSMIDLIMLFLFMRSS